LASEIISIVCIFPAPSSERKGSIWIPRDKGWFSRVRIARISCAITVGLIASIATTDSLAHASQNLMEYNSTKIQREYRELRNGCFKSKR
jgi:hypothetical protein